MEFRAIVDRKNKTGSGRMKHLPLLGEKKNNTNKIQRCDDLFSTQVPLPLQKLKEQDLVIAILVFVCLGKNITETSSLSRFKFHIRCKDFTEMILMAIIAPCA